MAHPPGSGLRKPRHRRVATNNRFILEPAQVILESANETTMKGIGKYKLADALGQPPPEAGGGKRGKPLPSHETAAEQVREATESGEATGAVVSNRDRMVDIGRGNRQAGRQGQ